MPKVKVYNDNFDKAMRKFKKAVSTARTLEEAKERMYYEKPCAKRNRKKAAAKARQRKQLQTDALQKRKY